MRTALLSVVAALAASALAAAASAQDADALKSGEAWYVWSNGGKPCGYFHAVRQTTGDPGVIVLKHELEIMWRGKRLSLKMETTCMNDECLSPVKIVCEGKGDDEFGNFTATIAREAPGPSAGKLTATREGRKIGIDLPERTVTDFAIMAIVRSRPFDRDKTFEFNSLESSELNLKKGHKLAYVGEQEVMVAGEKMKLHAFEQTGGGIRPIYYWVNDRRQLVRILMDERKEYVLTTKEKAAGALE